MPIVRFSGADADTEALRADLAASGMRSEAEIEADAAEDGNAWTEEDFANAIVVHPPLTASEIRGLRDRLARSEAQFALRFGFSVDAVQSYEQGAERPWGPASTLLQVIAADPDAVLRALQGGPRRI